MKIKQAEELSGVSRQNIRFYEREGLLSPDRNSENDYREYHEEHILILKQIRAMRMVDMPLDQIRLVLEGHLSPAEAAQTQREKLVEQQAQLAAAIRFCDELRSVQTIDDMNVDDILNRMDKAENATGLFQQWIEDYRKLVLSEQEKLFTFVPEDPVRNPREFTMALINYANAHNLDMVITREGMHPEFTINGIEYEAARFYTAVSRIPVAVIRCRVKNPEDFEPDIPAVRKKALKLLYWGLVPVMVTLVLLCGIVFSQPQGFFRSGVVLVLFFCFLALSAVSLYRFLLFYYNSKH